MGAEVTGPQSCFVAVWRRVRRIASLTSLVPPLLGVWLVPAAGQSVPKLIYSPWTKFCAADPQASGKPVCRTVRFGRTEAGLPIVAAILTEPEGDAKTLRVVLPIGVQLPQGARVIVDGGQPLKAPYAACFSKGCMVDFEASAQLIGKLRDGRTLMVQAIGGRGDITSIDLPLEDFAKAYDGSPATEVKLVHQLQEQLPERGSQVSGELEQQLRKGNHLRYSPWKRFCLKQDDGQTVCFTGTEGRFGSGPAVVAAVLIETVGGAKRVFRVTLPLGMQMSPGTRVLIDNGQQLTAPYIICLTHGCMADLEASDELIGRLKAGQMLTVQGVNSQGQAVSPTLPLAEFAKAHDGPPMDSKKLEESQKKLQEQLKKGLGSLH